MKIAVLLLPSRKAPNGFTALVATGNGNCMYNSVSLLIFGSERYASHLRLLSAIHALDHFDHYLATVSFHCIFLVAIATIYYSIIYYSYQMKFKKSTQHNSL